MTPEQEAAQGVLQDAIEAHCKVWNIGAPDLAVEWALVVYAVEVETQRDGYYTVYSYGTIPDHRALGLFHTGIRIIETATAIHRTEEDE